MLPAAVPHPCPKTFTVAMAMRAARANWRGERQPTPRDARHMRRFLRCQRNPHARRFVLFYYRTRKRAWRERRAHPWQGPVTASWYDDTGSTACGTHYTYGFASLFLACGTRIEMRGPGGTVVATMQDHGPYITGRTFDLNPGLKAALGCGDLCAVSYR